MIVHEMMEKSTRIKTTTLATGPADVRRPSIPPVYKSTFDISFLWIIQ
jgi:hypothetical protein